MSLANEVTMRRFVEEVINNGNLPVLDEIIHPKYVFRSPGQELHGREGLRGLFTAYRTAFPDLHVKIDDLVIAGDKAVLSFALSGTHEGDLMGIAATGNQVKVNGMTLSRFESGKIVEEWELLDQLNMFQQLGIVSVQSQTQTNNH
ncbi:MAG: ester cyclase [Chromatiales bacterium]|nr:ester cyclase [Chromatiales bacterium]